MDKCNSCKNSVFVVPRSSAKLILLDGTLMEFDTPVKVSRILKNDPSSSFICDSDHMEFNNLISALANDDELKSGRLYFSLPLSWLKHPLRPADMAGLAVKASSAFTGGGGGGLVQCGCGLGINEHNSSRNVTKKAKGDGKRRKYYRSTADLSVIPE